MSFPPEMYEAMRAGCRSSAAVVAPIVQSWFAPRRVIDVGGGEGWWARAFLEAGADYALVLDESHPGARRENVGDAILEFDRVDLQAGPLSAGSTSLSASRSPSIYPRTPQARSSGGCATSPG